MSWRDNLQPAKLGKSSFQIDTSGAQLGRNVQVHEYPGRDTPYSEDLGRKTRHFQLDCYVLADAANNYDYMPERDALIAELETAGNKTLVHPYLGEMTVTVVDCDGPRESSREGGMARFTITVVESGQLAFPSSTTDTQESARKRAANALQEVSISCARRFSVEDASDQVREAAVSLLEGWATELSTLTAYITTVPSALTDFTRDLSEFSSSASQLILVPQTMTSTALALFEQFDMIVQEPPAALEITRGLFGFGDDNTAAPAFGAASRVQQDANEDAFNDFIQQAALLTAVRVATDIDFDSADEALNLRDELLDVFDNLAESASDDTAYYALVDARTAFVEDMQTRAAQLNRLMKVTLPESRPALALAFELYADATRDAEIIARNQVVDPLFLPGGVELEVLTNG